MKFKYVFIKMKKYGIFLINLTENFNRKTFTAMYLLIIIMIYRDKQVSAL
jgi:hypothetical protein